MRKPRSFNTKLEILNAVKDKRSMRKNTKKMSLKVLQEKGAG